MSVFFRQNNIIVLAVMIMLVGMCSMWQFFSLERAFVFTDFADDSYTSYLPSWYVDEALSHEGLLGTYSFYHAAGNSYVQNIPLDPIGFVMFWIGRLALMIAGVKGLAITYFYGKFLISFLGTGIFTYLWLRELNVSKYASLIAGLFAAFSGGIVVLSLWNIEMYGFYLAFYLYATEVLLARRRPWFFAIAVAMLASQPYQLYLYTLFVGIYLIFRVIILKYSFRRIGLTVLWMIGMGILGLLINLPQLLNSLTVQMSTTRMSGALDSNDFATSFFLDGSMWSSLVLRLFGHNIAGNEFFINQWNNVLEAPALYCGIITLLVFPQIFQYIGNRKRIVYAAFLLIWFSVLIINPLRQAIVLNTGDYFRYGIDFFIIFALIMVMAQSLSVLIVRRSVNVPLLLASAVVCGLALWTYSDKAADYNGELQNAWLMYLGLGLLVFNTILLFVFANSSNRQFIKISICLLALFEVFVLTNSMFDGRSCIYLSDIDINRANYDDGFVKTLEDIRSKDSTKFYRIHSDYALGKSRHTGPNFNQPLGFYSTMGYNSFNQPEYVRYLQATGQSYPDLESDSRWLSGVNSNVFSLSFMGIKYFVYNYIDTVNVNVVMRHISDRWVCGKNMVTRFNKVMPLGFALNSYITEGEMRSLISFKFTEQEIDFVHKRILEAGLEPLEEVDVTLQKIAGKTFDDFQELKEILYAGMPKEYAYWTSAAIYTHSHETSLQEYALLSSFAAADDTEIDLAKYRKIDVSEEFPRDFFYTADVFSKYDSIVNKNLSQGLDITSFANNHIKGKIKVEGDNLMVLTIPYDKAWRCKVDGVDTPVRKCDVGFSGVELGDGAHDIELTYEPLYRNAAIWISIIAALIFYLSVLLFRKRTL